MKPGFHPALLSATAYRDGRTWYLNHPLLYLRPSGEVIEVLTRFETDYASSPRLTWALIPPTGTYLLPAVVHDWNYWTQRCTRREADDILLEGMTLLDVAKWQRDAIYWAVREFGFIAWRDNARLASEGYSRIRGMRGPANRPTWQRQMLRAAFVTPQPRAVPEAAPQPRVAPER